MLFNFVHACTCADSSQVSSTGSPITAIQSVQMDCMRLFTDPTVPEFYRPLFARLRDGWVNGINREVCSWKGVGCADGIIRMIEYELNEHEARTLAYVADMDWIPPSTVYLRLVGIRALNGWATERLPRELRFVSLVRAGVPNDHQPDRTINLAKLPSKMEELIVIAGWYNGIIYIDRLPETMRLLQLSQWEHAVAYVVFENLPKSLEALCVSNFIKYSKKRGTRIIPAGRKKSDQRIMLHDDFCMKCQFMDSVNIDLRKYEDAAIANIPSS